MSRRSLLKNTENYSPLKENKRKKSEDPDSVRDNVWS